MAVNFLLYFQIHSLHLKFCTVFEVLILGSLKVTCMKSVEEFEGVMVWRQFIMRVQKQVGLLRERKQTNIGLLKKRDF